MKATNEIRKQTVIAEATITKTTEPMTDKARKQPVSFVGTWSSSWAC